MSAGRAALFEAARGTRPRLLSLRSGHFWLTQALVLLTVVAIYVTEAPGIDTTDPDAARFLAGLHIAAVTFSFVPGEETPIKGVRRTTSPRGTPPRTTSPSRRRAALARPRRHGTGGARAWSRPWTATPSP